MPEKSLILHLTPTSETAGTLDKSYAEITAAVNAGTLVFVEMQGMRMPFVFNNGGIYVFGGTLYDSGPDEYISLTVFIPESSGEQAEATIASKQAPAGGVLLVNVTDQGDGVGTADKTLAEIDAAAAAGQVCYAVMNDVYMPMMMHTPGSQAVFNAYGVMNGLAISMMVFIRSSACTYSIEQRAANGTVTVHLTTQDGATGTADLYGNDLYDYTQNGAAAFLTENNSNLIYVHQGYASQGDVFSAAYVDGDTGKTIVKTIYVSQADGSAKIYKKELPDTAEVSAMIEDAIGAAIGGSY